MLSFLFSFLFVILNAANDRSEFSFSGYVDMTSDGQKIWVEYQKPKNDGPLIVLLNGLTYSTKDWTQYKSELQKAMPDAGFLIYDMRWQGKTLVPISDLSDLAEEYTKVGEVFKKITGAKSWSDWRKYWTTGEYFWDWVEWKGSLYKLWEISKDSLNPKNMKDTHYSRQVSDLKELVEAFKGQSKVHLVGLSYGGAIGEAFVAKYSELVESFLMVAPFVKRLPQQHDWITSQIKMTKFFNPLFSASEESLYLFYLRVLVYSTYPLAEPTLLKNPFRTEGAFRLAAGTLDFDGVKIAEGSDQSKTYLITAGKEEYVPPQHHQELWAQLKTSGAQTQIIIDNTDHKINLSYPEDLANLTRKVIYGELKYSHGETYHFTAERHILPTSRCLRSFL